MAIFAVEKDFFDSAAEKGFSLEELEQFWRFVYARQEIWHKRYRLGLERPWSTNRVFQEERFANIYRELDPGTKHVVESVLEQEAPVASRVFTTAIYRTIGSREDVQKHFGILDPREFDATQWADEMRALNKTQPVFGSAYRVCAYSTYGERDQIGNTAKMIDDIAYLVPRILQKVSRQPDPTNAFKNLRLVPGLGPFLSNQILNDLTYPLHVERGASLFPMKTLRYAQEIFSWAGPGAKAGIKRLMLGSLPGSEVILRLRDMQRAAWKQFDLDFDSVAPTWRDLHPTLSDEDFKTILKVDPDSVAPISLSNIEGCLCEYYKFAGISEGTVRGRRKFWTPPVMPVAALQAVKTCVFCAKVGTSAYGIILPNMLSAVFVCEECAEHQTIAAVGRQLQVPEVDDAPLDENDEEDE